MGRWVFVDTSAFVGILLRRDEWHDPAMRGLEGLRQGRRRLMTSTDVFGELVTSLRKWAGYARAREVGESLQGSALVRIVEVDEGLRKAGWDHFVMHRFPSLSFVDCTSFALMDRFGIEEAFTFDSDFRRAGYRMIPG